MYDKKFTELMALLDELTPTSPSSVRHALFSFIRQYWDEFEEAHVIQEKVCKKLDISKMSFNMLLMNPELSYGLESLHRNIGPGWLKDYIDYTAGHEAPEDFHVWVGLTIISCVLRRKVYFDNVYYKLYPNLYTILISPPGVGKKTTAINMGVSILREAAPYYRIISEKCTPEALARRLSRPIEVAKESGGMKITSSAEGAIIAPELTVFMGPEKYNAGMITMLTRLYDCADIQEVDTITRGIEKLKNVCVSLLGATTPSEIHRAIPAAAMGGGLASRLNIVSKDSTPRIVPFAAPMDKTVREMLVNDLRKVEEKYKGAFSFTDGGKEWYKEYYKAHHLLVEKGGGFLNIERQPDHIMKIAMCLRAAEFGSYDIDQDVLQRSYNIVNTISINSSEIARVIDTNERGKLANYVLDLIKRSGGVMERSPLMKRCWRRMNSVELDVVLRTLEEAGVLSSFLKEKKKFYKITSFEE